VAPCCFAPGPFFRDNLLTGPKTMEHIDMNRQTTPSLLQRTLGILLSSLLLLSFTANANANVAPHDMLESVTKEIFTTLKAEQETIHEKPTHLFDLVERVLLPHVDMSVMSRYVLGKYWRRADDKQREQFIKEFQNLLVRFYVSALLDDPAQLDDLLADTEGLISYIPVNLDAETRKTIVRAEVHMPNGGPKVPVSFNLFRNEGGDWMMYDVNVDGISLVTNYRSSFAAEIKRDGLDALIARLAERNQELLEQALAKNGEAQTKTAE
jgi:phospholipid transport system substrate-binding protein